MKDHSECKRQFTQLSRAWYADANLRGSEVKDEITIGYYHLGGGTTGEFCIRWIELSKRPTPMLNAFEDSWSALWNFRDVLEKLADLDSENPTPEEICKVLVSCDVEDRTPEKSPYGDDKKTKGLYSKPNSAGYEDS